MLDKMDPRISMITLGVRDLDAAIRFYRDGLCFPKNGLSLIREARKTAPGLPVIVITGFSTEETAADAVALGVAGYLTKPFRLSRILAATARALGEPVPAAEASPS
jgi:DNA-binding NtrC family response regulator